MNKLLPQVCHLGIRGLFEDFVVNLLLTLVELTSAATMVNPVKSISDCHWVLKSPEPHFEAGGQAEDGCSRSNRVIRSARKSLFEQPSCVALET